nr:MAG TPA: hypothetical protein [Caudoviricetes sp.]
MRNFGVYLFLYRFLYRPCQYLAYCGEVCYSLVCPASHV